ncbi:hypothetical protein DPMN_180116 [Dreissena polymorpha]|uniref:Uncharacterized protein n=1 Tax=Dreissena polymorpha TaxID=45954 RepID=A0A9D4EHI4_DREPO|nr:hypothetical protein DPMN_179891 [Dreissena polymorpha]KAH3778646.1 hypothetical protein DPMN_180116 [Dreissena polymorpha]
MTTKPDCLLLWIPQGKTCVLQDHQACLPTSVDTLGKGLCSAGSSACLPTSVDTSGKDLCSTGSPSLPSYFC